MRKRKIINSNNIFTYFIFIAFLIVSAICIISTEIDKKEINRLEKQNKKLYIEVHNYEWMTDQYKYMFDKYCGGMNNN